MIPRDLLLREPDSRIVDPGAITTGFVDLDNALGGFHQGDLVLVADDDQGDNMASILALHFALTAAGKEHVPTGFISLTTSSIQVGLALLAVHAGRDRYSIRRRLACDEHVNRAAQHLGTLPISVRSPASPDLVEVEDEILQLKHDHRLVVVMGLDTLVERHRLPPAHVLGRVHRLARSVKLPVLCVVPLGYFSVVDADICLQVEEAVEGRPFAQVHIARNRHGGTGLVNLFWDSMNEILGSLGTGEVDDGGQRFMEAHEEHPAYHDPRAPVSASAT